jgi:hypothetical protein
MTVLRERVNVPASWASAGIVDALAFTVGDSATVHEPTHAQPNLIRGRCGIVARIIESDRPTASWADSFTTCPTCIARGARRGPPPDITASSQVDLSRVARQICQESFR